MSAAGAHEARMRSRLSRNVAWLFLIQLANFALPIVTLPYLTRVLRASGYGLLAFSGALIAYFIIVTDFGFSITGTRAAAALRDDPRRLGALLASITVLRLLLMSASLVLLVSLVLAVPRFSRDALVYFGSAISLLAAALFPGWLLQGLEDMRTFVTATLLGRLVSVVMIFAWVRGPEDVALAAALQSTAQLLALAVVAKPLMRRIPPTYWRIDPVQMRAQFADSRDAFVSFAATSLYTSSVTFVLGLLSPAAVVGTFSAASRIVTAVSSVLWGPASQAVFPRLSALLSHHDRDAADRLLLQVLRVLIPVVAAATVALWLFAEPIARLVVGPEMQGAPVLLRTLAPLPALLILSNFFGVLVLYAHGQFWAVSRLQIATACVSMAWLIPLILFAQAQGAAWSVLMTESVITLGFIHLCRTRGFFLWTRTFS